MKDPLVEAITTGKFTEKLCVVLNMARKIAVDHVGTEHLLLALIASNTFSGNLLRENDITEGYVRARMKAARQQAEMLR